MNSARHLCGPQISCFRPGLTSLLPSILLPAPTLGLALQDAFGRSVLNIETGTPQGAVEGMSGGQLRRSARSSSSVSYCWPWETLSHQHIPDACCSHAVSLSLSGSFLQHIVPNIHADLPYKAACLETIIFMCCCVKSQDHKITRLQHNHFQASGRLRPSPLLRALSVFVGESEGK